MKSTRGTSMSPMAGQWRLAQPGSGPAPLSTTPPALGGTQPVTNAPQFSVESLRLRELQADIRQDVIRNHLVRTLGKGEADKLEKAIDDFKTFAVDDPKALLPKAELILQYLIFRDELMTNIENGNLDNLIEAGMRLEDPELRIFRELLTPELMQARKTITVLKRKAMIPVTLTFDDRAMRELRRYHKPPKIMRDVITATFLLLGECEDYTADWSVAREMLNPFGKSTGCMHGGRRIRDRFDDFNPQEIHPEVGARVREILEPYSLSNVYEVSECCATFFVWCTAALAAAEKIIGNSKPASLVRQREIFRMNYPLPTARSVPRKNGGRIYQPPRGTNSPTGGPTLTGRLLPAVKKTPAVPTSYMKLTGNRTTPR